MNLERPKSVSVDVRLAKNSNGFRMLIRGPDDLEFVLLLNNVPVLNWIVLTDTRN